MESHSAQPVVHFVGSPCRRGPTRPYLRRRRCLFFHSEDETASASVVGQDHPPDASVMERLARLERVVEDHEGLRDHAATRSSGARAGVRGGADCRRCAGRPTSINQATKNVDFQQPNYTDRFVDVPVAMQRQVPQRFRLCRRRGTSQACRVPRRVHTSTRLVDVPVVRATKGPSGSDCAEYGG